MTDHKNLNAWRTDENAAGRREAVTIGNRHAMALIMRPEIDVPDLSGAQLLADGHYYISGPDGREHAWLLLADGTCACLPIERLTVTEEPADD